MNSFLVKRPLKGPLPYIRQLSFRLDAHPKLRVRNKRLRPPTVMNQSSSSLRRSKNLFPSPPAKASSNSRISAVGGYFNAIFLFINVEDERCCSISVGDIVYFPSKEDDMTCFVKWSAS